MLQRLHLRNFTVFEDADFAFGPGLNVIVGANGTGKSHVLKVGYLTARVTAKILNDDHLSKDKPNWRRYVGQRLTDLFQSEELGKLVRWSKKKGVASVDATLGLSSPEHLVFEFTSSTKQFGPFETNSVSVNNHPKEVNLSRAIFIPPKEVLTLAWLRSIYEKRSLPIDDTYPSLVELLFEIPVRKIDLAVTKPLRLLENILGGAIQTQGERFYLVSKQRRLDINLVAEGVRKFAMLARLLHNGVLVPGNPVFWDEPEANLNPALLKEMAAVLTELAKAGFQIILATHSLFLLKELHILARQEQQPVRYFGLSAEPGEATTVATADNLELLPDIVALDAELDQSDRFQRVLDQEDADGN